MDTNEEAGTVSDMAGEKKERRPRRSFTDEFKAEVVKRVLSGTKTAGQVARELDLTETAVRAWVKQAKIDSGKGPVGALTTAEREELSRLRREVRELKEDREILKNFSGPLRLPPVAAETPGRLPSALPGEAAVCFLVQN